MAPRALSPHAAAAALAPGSFNLIRRGHDGSLVLSADRWRCAGIEGNVLRFEAVDPQGGDPPPLLLALDDLDQTTWDRLPKQQTRSQVRFKLQNGDLLTFSGRVDESALPADGPSLGPFS
jgi:hypothetical protein